MVLPTLPGPPRPPATPSAESATRDETQGANIGGGSALPTQDVSDAARRRLRRLQEKWCKIYDFVFCRKRPVIRSVGGGGVVGGFGGGPTGGLAGEGDGGSSGGTVINRGGGRR